MGRSPAIPDRPLARLLSDVLLELTRLYERAGAGEDPLPSLTLWSGLLRAVPSDGITVRELIPRTRLSKRAIVSWIGVARTWGYLEAPTGRALRMDDLVRPTSKLQAAAREWPEVASGALDLWTARVGTSVAGDLRAAVSDLVAKFPIELPHYPVGYGSADWSMTGGNSHPAIAGPPRLPHHGADWKPVLRSDEDTVSDLELPALVSQVLMWMQIDCESVGAYPQVVSDVIDRIPPEGVALRDQPALAGVTGDGRSGFERHGVLEVTTKAGRRSSYEPLWRTACRRHVLPAWPRWSAAGWTSTARNGWTPSATRWKPPCRPSALATITSGSCGRAATDSWKPPRRNAPEVTATRPGDLWLSDFELMRPSMVRGPIGHPASSS